MADIQEGVSSPDVQKIQRQINSYYQASVVAESGDFDSATTDAVKRFQKDVKIRPTGVVDVSTLKLLIKPPKIPAHRVTINGQEVIVTEEQYKAMCLAVAKAAAPIVDGFRRKAVEARNLWDAHNEVRKSTFFLIPAMVDAWSGASFPADGVIKAAETAVAKMVSAVKSLDPAAINAALRDGQKPVEAAVLAIKKYRDEMYDGGEDLIKTLEMVKEGCVDVLEVSAAVATGGASIEVTAAVMAGVGAYKSTLGQIDKASKTTNFNIVDAFGNVLVDGAVAGTVGALLHDSGFMGSLTGSLSKKLGATVLGKFGSDVAAKVAEKALKGGLDKAVEAAVKDMVEAFKPGSKMTMDKAVKDITEELLKGAAFGGTCGKMEDQLEAFTKGSIKFFKPGMFKGLGKVDMKKAFDKGGEQIVEVAMKRLGKSVILDAADNPNKMGDVGSMMAQAIASDPKVNAEMAELVKKQKLE
jgi:peptidoglycan hydrolase-like protein with peptidoglycan-binding domain